MITTVLTSLKENAALNVLLVTLGSAGDVFPFVGVGRALLARGHRVTLLTNSHFEPVVRQAGLEFVELGTEDDFRRPRSWIQARRRSSSRRDLGCGMGPRFSGRAWKPAAV